MQIKSKAWVDHTKWHLWFAWHPVRIPQDSFADGKWIWLETVWRKVSYGWGAASWDYCDFNQKTSEYKEKLVKCGS